MPEHLIPEPENDDWLDRVIDNRYRILERIGHGGMGAVYKVMHTQMGKIAAMKLLHSTLACDPELIKRFHREATAISKLNHPNIIQVFDFGKAYDSVYLVMEYLRGEDLGHILRRNGPLELGRSSCILLQICDALAEAHEQRIVHRDLKPENISIQKTKDGQDFIKVLDFGLAKILEEEKELSITAKGNLVGTPYYMAPEMIRSEPLDHRCDIYSLGAMAYRMLTGENAFTAKTPVGVLTKHITDEVIPPSTRAPTRKIPTQFDAIVLKAMAKNREERYATALDVKRAILTMVEELSVPMQGNASYPHLSSPAFSGSQPNITPREDELAFSPTGRLDSSTPGISDILAKEDLVFEKRLRRGRYFKLLFLVPIVAALGFGLYWYGLRKGEIYAPAEEIEPNNRPDQATPLFNGTPISGRLGQRVSANESDRDWYQIQVDGAGPQTIQARVSAISNMDITLELFDRAGGRLTGTDSSGKGGPEVLTNWILDPGQYYLLVREVWLIDVPPSENVTDAYHLDARWHPYASGWEIEPNDRPDQASRLKPGEKLRGYLGGFSDLDVVKVDAAAGTLGGRICGLAGLDLILEIQLTGNSEPLIIDEGSVGVGERFSDVQTDGKEPLLITIRAKEKGKWTGREPKGLSTPYTLEMWAKP